MRLHARNLHGEARACVDGEQREQQKGDVERAQGEAVGCEGREA
jgi:hypothetical protein